MSKLGVFLGAACAAGVAMLGTRDAHALGPVGIELGAKAGAGTNPVGDGSPNPLGFGIGGRGGVSIFGLYGGVSGLYYLGSSNNEDGSKVSVHSAVYGFEAGYGIKLLGLLTIRPEIGIGNDETTVKVSGDGTSSSANKGYLYLEPNALVMISIGIIYVGADVGALLLPSGPYKSSSPCDKSSCSSFDAALTVHGQVGIHF